MTGSTLGDVTLAVHQVFIILPLAILVSAIRPVALGINLCHSERSEESENIYGQW
jgi:hypothetical protein